jgi:hypothetical protein
MFNTLTFHPGMETGRSWETIHTEDDTPDATGYWPVWNRTTASAV